MFDGLGQAGNNRRAQTTIPSSKRDHYANLNQQRHQERREKDDSPRGAAGGGKGHVMFVEKNMPSIVGVLGDVDRLYRPEVAERLFGPPEVEADPMQIAHGRHQATERSKNASGERVQIKAYNSNNQMALPPRPRAAAAAGTSASINFFASATPGTREVSSSSSVRGGRDDGNNISNATADNTATDVNRISTRRAGALPAHELRKLQHRAQLLEHQLHTCTNTIHNREAEIQILQGLRDLHIAKKKTRLGYQVSSYETLHRQVRRAVTATAAAAPPPLSSSLSPAVGQPADNQNSSVTTGRVKSFVDHFTHHAAERAVNHNRLTQQHAVPIFSAGAGLPGDTDGFAAPERHRRGGAAAVVRQETMTAPADVLATTNSSTAASADANAVAGPRHRESAQWRQAPSLNARALMDRVAVPPVRCHTSHLPVGPRHFPHLQSTLAPFAAQDQQPMPQRRDLAPARITSPALWLQRQAHQSVSDFNKAIVFTPNLRRDPMPIRTNTIPLVGAKQQQQQQQTPPPQAPTEEGSA